MIKEILFYAGFFLIIFLFSQEFARAVTWLRAHVQQHPRRRLLLYPVVLVLLAAAGIIIAHSLIRLCTSLSFTYD